MDGELTSSAAAGVTLARQDGESLVTILGVKIAFWPGRCGACNMLHLLLYSVAQLRGTEVKDLKEACDNNYFGKAR